MIIDIPIEQVPKDALDSLIEEFVTRQGTNYGEADYTLKEMVEQVKTALKNQKAILQYDDETETLDIFVKD